MQGNEQSQNSEYCRRCPYNMDGLYFPKTQTVLFLWKYKGIMNRGIREDPFVTKSDRSDLDDTAERIQYEYPADHDQCQFLLEDYQNEITYEFPIRKSSYDKLANESMERMFILMEEFARRYKDRWIIGAYDCVNEPLSVTPRMFELIPGLKDFYSEMFDLSFEQEKHRQNANWIISPSEYQKPQDIDNSRVLCIYPKFRK